MSSTSMSGSKPPQFDTNHSTAHTNPYANYEFAPQPHQHVPLISQPMLNSTGMRDRPPLNTAASCYPINVLPLTVQVPLTNASPSSVCIPPHQNINELSNHESSTDGSPQVPLAVAEYHRRHAKCLTWVAISLTFTTSFFFFLVLFYPLIVIDESWIDEEVQANCAMVKQCPERIPVCGSDGYWYANKCIAMCARVSVAQKSDLCEHAPKVSDINLTDDLTLSIDNESENQKSAQESTDVTRSVFLNQYINRHIQNGFRFLGVVADKTSQTSHQIPFLDDKGEKFSNFNFQDTSNRFHSMMKQAHQKIISYVPEALIPTSLTPSADVISRPDESSWILIDSDGAMYVKTETASNQEEFHAKSQRLFRSTGPDSSSNFHIEGPPSKIPWKGLQRNQLNSNVNGCGLKGHLDYKIDYSNPITKNKFSNQTFSSRIASDGAEVSRESTQQFKEIQDEVPVLGYTDESADSPFVHSSYIVKKDRVEDDEDERRRLVLLAYDSRTRVTATEEAPFRQVGQFAPLGCSGTLIGPSHVLTAAHCLWARGAGTNDPSLGDSSGQWLNSDYFYAGRTEFNTYRGKAKVSRKLIHRSYRDLYADEFEFDFGLAELESPLGEELGWLGVQYDCEDTGEVELSVIGYPVDKPKYSVWQDTCNRIPSGCGWRSVPHLCDTAPGMSGSPMIKKNEETGEYYVRAVHVAGSYEINRATLIGPQVFQSIYEWRDNKGFYKGPNNHRVSCDQ